MVQKLTSDLQDPPAPIQSRSRKRKQSIERELETSLDPDPDTKQQRTSPPHPTETAFSEPAISSGAHKPTDPVAF